MLIETVIRLIWRLFRIDFEINYRSDSSKVRNVGKYWIKIIVVIVGNFKNARICKKKQKCSNGIIYTH